MRCPSCGTENAPDSRFCGGCGAKQASEVRVAPTAKISDDAPLAPPRGITPSSNPASIPPTSRPASIPPTSRPASIPPSSRPPTARPVSQLGASQSIAPPRKRWGLIAVVLLADVGLATAGAVMLARGLTPVPGVKPEAKPVEPVKKPEPAKSAAVVTPITPAEAAPPIVTTTGAAARKPAPMSVEDKKHGKPEPTPIDPYGPSFDHEVDEQATKSQPELDRCLHDASATAPIHGAIRISFQILATGAVARATAVDNTTGSLALANCLTTAITGWTFPPHAGEPAEFVRPFTYP